MAEITLKLEIQGFKKEKLEELEKDIKLFMRFKLARDALLKEWEKRFRNSELSEEECIKLGRKVNKSTFKLWEEKGWL